MRILHLNAGNETGGGMFHILGLLETLNREEFVLGLLEKGELWKRANQAGIRTVHFSHKTKMSISLLRKMKGYLASEQISYVHTHGPRANVYANILRKMTGFQWVTTIHSDPFHDFSGKGLYGGWLSWLHMQSIRNADHIITVSEPFRKRLMENGVDERKITTTWNGIDFRTKNERSYARDQFGLSDKDFIFLMVARLEPVKGHKMALRAFAEVLQMNGNCQLILLGDGSLRNELIRMTNELHIDDHVHFLGYRQDIEQFYRLADITLLTSFSEGFPLVLLESAREKTPVISTNVGSVDQLIIHPSLGWKIRSGDIKELISAMKEAVLCRENGTLTRMGDQLYHFASSQFSLKTFAQNIYNVYLGLEDIN